MGSGLQEERRPTESSDCIGLFKPFPAIRLREGLEERATWPTSSKSLEERSSAQLEAELWRGQKAQRSPDSPSPAERKTRTQSTR